MRTPGARASRLFCRPVLRAALGGDAISLTGQMREVRFIRSFLGSFTHSAHLGQICTEPQDTVANGGTALGVLTSLSSETICPAARRAQERCQRPHGQKCQGWACVPSRAVLHLSIRGHSPSRPRRPPSLSHSFWVSLAHRAPHPVPRETRAPQELIS